jgi:hypothetical protein
VLEAFVPQDQTGNLSETSFVGRPSCTLCWDVVAGCDLEPVQVTIEVVEIAEISLPIDNAICGAAGLLALAQ